MLEQNFYEILELAPDATDQEIDRAYRIARATYQPASTATYSLFSDAENAELLRRIDEAYAVLSDSRMRGEYDERLRGEQSRIRGRDAHEARRAELQPRRAETRARALPAEPEFLIEDPEDPNDGVYDGHALRRIRISRGMELEEISEVTKITETYLQFIEENRYEDLPALVYLRGFLREIAKCLKLEPTRVADSYLAEYRARTGNA
jgi:curved DNA-binding protein CbpA